MALLKFKRSAVPGKVPGLADLPLGELAINTYDGKLYIRKDNGTASIVEVGGGSGVLSFNSRTGAVTLTSGDVTGALGFTPANKAGDTFSGAVTFSGGINPNFEIRAEGGTEGGQFIMQKAPSGSTLSGNLIIDTVGDAIRFFDAGGTNRGAYLNIMSQGTGAGSRILTDTTLTSGNVTTALGYTPANKAGDTFTGPVTINNGSHQVTLAYDGNIEITRSGGGAYIDFKDSTGEDFDARIQQSGSGFALTGLLTVSGTGLNAAIRFSNSTGGRDLRLMQKDGGYLAITDETAGAERLTINSSGNVSALVDFRAPIFYDSNDTGYYLNPNGFSKVQTFGVMGEREYPGSINSDWEGGYYHFGPSNDTPTGSYGHAHIIRLNASWNVQMFFPTSNTNEPMWLRRKQDGTYSAWRRLLQEDEWIGGKYFASDGRIYATILYDANDGSCYVDPSGTSWFKGNIYNWRQGASNDTFGGLELREADGVGNAQSAATYAPGINFHWSMRAAARIYMDASGNFVLGGQSDITNNRRTLYAAGLYANADVRGTIFYDSNDTGYYCDPNSTSRFVRLALGGAGAVYQGCIWAEDNVWLSGNGRKIAFTTDGSTDDGGNVSIFAWGNDFRINNWSGSALNDNFYVFGASRDAACAGNITAYYSDDRLKTKTGTIADALTKVASLEGFTYVENETARSVGYANDRQQVGVSAQAVQAVLPEAVHLAPFDYDVAEDGTITSKSGENYLTVDYSRIVPLLIEAIKELNNKVESLEAELRNN